MINRKMKPYKLYINEPMYDETNRITDNYVYQQDVLVAVNFLSENRISNDIRYKDCRYTGLTIHKGFCKKKEYKLVENDEEYLIKSINELSRLTQLLLQEVF